MALASQMAPQWAPASDSPNSDSGEVIIPGEAPLCVLLASQGVAEVDGVPVLDSLSCWIKQAELLVDLRRQSGIERCRRGYFHEPPPRERVNEILAFYGLDRSAVPAVAPGPKGRDE